MLSDSERLYILIVQYGLARDAEYENKIKRLQGLICRRDVDLKDLIHVRFFRLFVQAPVMGAFLLVNFVSLVSSLHLLGADWGVKGRPSPLCWKRSRVYGSVLCL